MEAAHDGAMSPHALPDGIRPFLSPSPDWRRPHSGHALIEALGALALIGLISAQALPTIQAWSQHQSLVQARARFESDWHWARWRAQQSGNTLRLQALPGCPTVPAAGDWHCGWQWVIDGNSQLVRESHLPAGIGVTPKPTDGWRFDAWGEPLGGGASVLFQSSASLATTPELLCLNVLGRLRRVQGDTCSD